MLTVPGGTSSGKKLRLRGRGLPAKWRQGAPRGDLYARIAIAVPARLSTEERGLMEQLARVSMFAPRAPVAQ
ncbi:MAG: hypothetical protein CFE44_23435 [Burkholderiales bacterium PBB4]|nr:MAG: hypothetical protein CFE44_23435 [Burkholderiales bacterium PBB4]